MHIIVHDCNKNKILCKIIKNNRYDEQKAQ